MITDPRGLDLTRFREYLDVVQPGLLAGELSATLIEGGKSNLSYLVTDGDGRWVVRRSPLGHVLATAHDMSREYRVICALAGTPVPVPVAVCLCEDTSVIGAPFYVMRFVDGVVYRGLEQSAQLSVERAGAVADQMMDVLARLHQIDPAQVGLGDFGRPDGYLERQLRRWSTQLEKSRTRELAGIDELHAALAAARPGSQAVAIVHGDFRLDNLIIEDSEQPQVKAVLDWEMSTLGDPLTDLGLLLCYWDGVSAMPGAVAAAVGPASPFPRGGKLIDRYAHQCDLDLSDLPWYEAFGYFKLAVILEGIYVRHAAGQTVGAGFDGIGSQVHALIEMGHSALRGR